MAPSEASTDLPVFYILVNVYCKVAGDLLANVQADVPLFVFHFMPDDPADADLFEPMASELPELLQASFTTLPFAAAGKSIYIAGPPFDAAMLALSMAKKYCKHLRDAELIDGDYEYVICEAPVRDVLRCMPPPGGCDLRMLLDVPGRGRLLFLELSTYPAFVKRNLVEAGLAREEDTMLETVFVLESPELIAETARAFVYDLLGHYPGIMHVTGPDIACVRRVAAAFESTGRVATRVFCTNRPGAQGRPTR